jgi:Family of unknown function (DUF5765)
MCWSGEASAVLATVGLASTTYIALKGEDKRLWLPLGYFSLMEALQAVAYTVIGQCDAPLNQIVTLLGYFHIVFQPFFINMISLYFIPPEIRRKIEPWVVFFTSVGVLTMLVSTYPFEWAPVCQQGVAPFCSPKICSMHGSWHISWGMPRSVFGYVFGVRAYTVIAFVLPLLYGSWRFTMYHILTGPFMAAITSGDLNEWAAVWCLFSIGLLLIAIKTPLRTVLHVRRWFWWKWIYPVAAGR